MRVGMTRPYGCHDMATCGGASGCAGVVIRYEHSPWLLANLLDALEPMEAAVLWPWACMRHAKDRPGLDTRRTAG